MGPIGAVLLGIVAILIILVVANIKIVPQSKAYVIERLGAYHTTWQTGLHVLIPVIEETAAKAVSSGNPASVQTGPAMRGDMPTLNRHRALIGENHLLRTIYDTISENIWRIKETSKR